MDQWMLESLQDYLPETLLQLVHDHVLRPDARLQTLKQQTTALARRAADAMWPVLGPALDRLTRALHDSPDLVVLGFFVLVLVLVVQLLSWLSRAMLFWTRLALRVLFWSAVAAVAAVVWQRGIGRTVGDVVDVGGKLVGYAVVVKDIWVREYHKYDAQAKGRGPPGSKFGSGRGR